MSDAPLVTIAIPAFNSEEWLEECVRSALAQSHENREVLVIDDGSTDGTAEVARAFGDAIHFVSRENRGSNPTRNEMLALARGEWIQFLDADDFLLADKLKSNLAATRSVNAGADAVYGPVLEDGVSTTFDDADDLFTRWIRWQFCQTGGMLWRTKPLRKIGGWNEEYPCCQDNELCARALQNGLDFAFDPQPGAVYRIHQNTLSRGNPVRVIDRKMRLQEAMLSWLEEHGHATEAHRHATGRALFESLRMLARHDLPEAVRREKQLGAEGRLRMDGPAAPPSYRMLHSVLGFRLAEKTAGMLRSR